MSEMLNESGLIEREVTLRNLRMTKEVTETRRSIIRWLALTLGVISPGESRLSAVSVLDAMLHFQFDERKEPSVPDIMDYITTQWEGMNEKTLRYHLLQLKKMNIISSEKMRYSLVWPDIGEKYDAEAWINGYIDREIIPIKNKVNMAMKELNRR